MKIEIDLQEILTDEYGDGESLAQSIRRQVIENLTAKVSEGIKAQIDAEVARVMSTELQVAVKEKMPALLNELLDAEFRVVNQWGERAKEMTTFRKELIKEITSQMVYKKTSYSSDRNKFTEAIDAVIAENVKVMQKDFDRQVCDMFQKQAFEYAMTQMAKKLQVNLTAADLVTPTT